MERRKATPEAITSHRLCICLYVYTDELPGLPDLCEVTTARLFVWMFCTIDDGCAVCLCVSVCRCGAPHRYADSFCKQESLCVQVDLAKKKKKKPDSDSGASACVYSCVCLPATHVSQCLCTC